MSPHYLVKLPMRRDPAHWLSRVHFTKIATGDLDISVVGQLPAANLPFGDEFEPGPVQVVGFEAPFGRGASESRIWKTRRETRTTPS